MGSLQLLVLLSPVIRTAVRRKLTAFQSLTDSRESTMGMHEEQ